MVDYNHVGPTTKSKTEKDFLYGKSVDRKKRKQVLYPDKKGMKEDCGTDRLFISQLMSMLQIPTSPVT